MPTNPRFALIEALARLARASPTEWENFMKEYRLHYGRTVDALVSVGAEGLPMMQGKARECREFWETCDTCREEAEKIGRSHGN